MEGVDGLLHSLDIKKRTWLVSKELLHIERFSASHCISLSFTHQRNSMDSWASTQPVAGNEMGCESDGLSRSHTAVREEMEESETVSELPFSQSGPLLCQ